MSAESRRNQLFVVETGPTDRILSTTFPGWQIKIIDGADIVYRTGGNCCLLLFLIVVTSSEKHHETDQADGQYGLQQYPQKLSDGFDEFHGEDRSVVFLFDGFVNAVSAGTPIIPVLPISLKAISS